MIRRVINSLLSLISRFWGNNDEQKRNERIVKAMSKLPRCEVCNLLIRTGWGQSARFHSYCRKFRKNKHGFDPTKIQL